MDEKDNICMDSLLSDDSARKEWLVFFQCNDPVLHAVFHYSKYKSDDYVAILELAVIVLSDWKTKIITELCKQELLKRDQMNLSAESIST